MQGVINNRLVVSSRTVNFLENFSNFFNRQFSWSSDGRDHKDSCPSVKRPDWFPSEISELIGQKSQDAT